VSFAAVLENDLRDNFFNTGEFARVVTYTPATGSPYSIRAIYDAAYQAVDPNTEQPVISTQPKITVPVHELSTVPGPGDTVTIDSDAYSVLDYQPDGKGVAEIILSRRSA